MRFNESFRSLRPRLRFNGDLLNGCLTASCVFREKQCADASRPSLRLVSLGEKRLFLQVLFTGSLSPLRLEIPIKVG